jgi:hypothetical protein
MKPKLDFDPMFRTNRRPWYRPLRWIGAVLIVATLGALTLRAGPIPKRRPVSPVLQGAAIPGRSFVAQGAVPNTQVRVVTPHDPFVIVAPAELDAAMVIRPRDDLDARMVINPSTRRRGSAPGSMPEGYRPVPSSPRTPATTRPR